MGSLNTSFATADKTSRKKIPEDFQFLLSFVKGLEAITPSTHNNKAEKLKINQQPYLNLSQNYSHRVKYSIENWKKQVNTENHSSPRSEAAETSSSEVFFEDSVEGKSS